MWGDKDTDMMAKKSREDNQQINEVPPKDPPPKDLPPPGREPPPTVAPVEESPPDGTEDPHLSAGQKSLVTAEVHHTDPIDKNLRQGAGGAIGRVISIRSAACDRRAAETALSTSLRSLELENDERNIGVHEVLCKQLLGMLEKEHHAYVGKKA